MQYRLLGLSILLAGCTQPVTIDPLPTEEVLRNVQSRSRELQSVRYNADIEFEFDDPVAFSIHGTATVSGRMTQRGAQMYSYIDGQARIDTTPAEVQMEVVTAPNETYMKMLNLDMGIAEGALSSPIFSELNGQWLRIVPEEIEEATISPDPAFIRAQTEVVRVIEDKGIQTLNGKPVYEFVVELDPTKAQEFFSLSASGSVNPVLLQSFLMDGLPSGTLWIDAHTFELRKAEWNIQTFIDDQGRAVSLHLEVMLSGHNAAKEITLPEEYVEIPEFMGSPIENAPPPVNDAEKERDETEEFTTEENHEMIDGDENPETGSGS